MKKLLYFLALSTICSCGEANKTAKSPFETAEFQRYEADKKEEEVAKKLIEDYIRDMNSSDWKSKAVKYLQPDSDAFLEEHTAFRKSFPNYESTIKHLAVDGNKVMLWLNIKANYAATYTFENSAYKDDILKGIEAKNQELSWDETWYFDVVDGKFGDEWDFLKDNYAMLAGLGELSSK